MKGRRLDLSTSEPPLRDQPDGAEAPRGKFLGIRFECCGVYARIYPNRSGEAYEGRCPKCLRAVRVGIGPGGSDARFFSAS